MHQVGFRFQMRATLSARIYVTTQDFIYKLADSVHLHGSEFQQF